jgi:hypothetical protein
MHLRLWQCSACVICLEYRKDQQYAATCGDEHEGTPMSTRRIVLPDRIEPE